MEACNRCSLHVERQATAPAEPAAKARRIGPARFARMQRDGPALLAEPRPIPIDCAALAAGVEHSRSPPLQNGFSLRAPLHPSQRPSSPVARAAAQALHAFLYCSMCRLRIRPSSLSGSPRDGSPGQERCLPPYSPSRTCPWRRSASG
jgi:hypothetical protein